MQILDGFFRVIPENIGFATCMKNIRLRFASSDIFPTCSSSNIFRYHPQAIQYCSKLGHSDWYLNHYSRTNNGRVRGHNGITGVKNVIFTKKASSPTECVALTRDLCICINLNPSTKVITLKIHPGSLGVTGSKGHFHQKGIKSYRMRSIVA